MELTVEYTDPTVQNMILYWILRHNRTVTFLNRFHWKIFRILLKMCHFVHHTKTVAFLNMT